MIARAAAPDAALTAQLERHGARVIVSPALEIAPPESFAAIDEAIENLYGYDWLIFTNANGVDYFLRRFQHLGRKVNELDPLRVCAIRETTARKLEASQIHVDLITEESRAAGIVAALVTYTGGPENLGRLNFLIPRAPIARDYLVQLIEDAGARVDAIVCYRTVASTNSELTNIGALLAGGGVDCLAFTTPAAVQDFAQLFDANDLWELLQGVAVASIDDATARMATEFGLETGIMPCESTPQTLAQAISAHFLR